MARFRIVPDRSKALIDARTNLHPVHAEADGLVGFVEVELADGRLDVSSPPRAEVRLEVERIHSSLPMFDTELRRRVDARRFPTVSGQTQEVGEAGGDGRYRVRGDVEFHGVSRTVDGEVHLRVEDDRTIVIEGEQMFDIRDFNVEPPRLLMLKADPEVTVRVELVARRED